MLPLAWIYHGTGTFHHCHHWDSCIYFKGSLLIDSWVSEVRMKADMSYVVAYWRFRYVSEQMWKTPLIHSANRGSYPTPTETLKTLKAHSRTSTHVKIVHNEQAKGKKNIFHDDQFWWIPNIKVFCVTGFCSVHTSFLPFIPHTLTFCLRTLRPPKSLLQKYHHTFDFLCHAGA